MRTFAIVTADSGDGGSQYFERTGKSNHIQDHNTIFLKTYRSVDNSTSVELNGD